MKKSYLRSRTIFCIVLLAVLLTACTKKKQNASDIVVEQLPPEEVELPDIKLSGVTLDKKDVIATIKVNKTIKGTDPLNIGGTMGVMDGYVEGFIDIGWFGDWENDVQPPMRLVVGVGTGASSITDVVGGGSGSCNESNCCKYTYSWAIQYLYIGYFYADPTCRLYGSITLEEWVEPVLVDKTGTCTMILPQELYVELFQTMFLKFDYTPEELFYPREITGPMAVTTVLTVLENFPWEDGFCKGN